MKKILLTLAVVGAAIAGLSACSQSASQKDGRTEGEEIKAKIENCTNADSLKLYVEQAQAYAAKLEAEGKGAEAASYLDEVTPVVEKKDPSVAGYFKELKDKAAAEVKEAGEAVDSVAGAAADKGKELADSVNSKGAAAVNAVTEKGAAAVDAAKSKGAEAVQQGKEKVSDAAQKGADKVKDLLK